MGLSAHAGAQGLLHRALLQSHHQGGGEKDKESEEPISRAALYNAHSYCCLQGCVWLCSQVPEDWDTTLLKINVNINRNTVPGTEVSG